MSDTIQQLFGQYANPSFGTDYAAGAAVNMMSAKDGQTALYQNQEMLVNSLFSSPSQGYDVFSPNFLYSAVTTWGLSQSDPTAFNISAENATGLGMQIQSNMAAQIYGSMMPADSNGVDVLGSLYAANGILSPLQTSPTYSFQALA